MRNIRYPERVSDHISKILGMKLTCLNCKSEDSIREIIWGMPDGEPDPSKYLVGGCCVSDDDPSHRCIECGWELRTKN